MRIRLYSFVLFGRRRAALDEFRAMQRERRFEAKAKLKRDNDRLDSSDAAYRAQLEELVVVASKAKGPKKKAKPKRVGGGRGPGWRRPGPGLYKGKAFPGLG